MQKIIENVANNILIGYLFMALIFIPIAGRFGSVRAQSIEACEEELKEAQYKYDTGRFDEVIEIVKECLNNENLSQEKKKKAYRLLGLTYVAKDYLTEAKTAVGKLLDIVPNYKPDPEQDPPTYVNIISEEINERKIVEKERIVKTDESTLNKKKQVDSKDEKSNTIWWYIGGGVVAVVAVLLLLVSGGDDTPPSENDLPGPPDLP
jgi:tetratricopeptide (TPR) repeat protein